MSGVQVEVRLAGTATVAPIYSDDGVTSKANPFTCDANGSYEYYAANGRYDEIVTKAGLTFDNDDFAGLRFFDNPVKVNTTAAGTPASTVETNLLIVTLPARTLNFNGQALRILAWGTTAANANTKRVRIYFGGSGGVGGSVIIDTGAVAANGRPWRLEALVMRTGPTSQDIIGIGIFNDTVIQTIFVAGATDLATAFEIRLTGQNGTASANDLVAKGLQVVEP